MLRLPSTSSVEQSRLRSRTRSNAVGKQVHSPASSLVVTAGTGPASSLGAGTDGRDKTTGETLGETSPAPAHPASERPKSRALVSAHPASTPAPVQVLQREIIQCSKPPRPFRCSDARCLLN